MHVRGGDEGLMGGTMTNVCGVIGNIVCMTFDAYGARPLRSERISLYVSCQSPTLRYAEKRHNPPGIGLTTHAVLTVKQSLKGILVMLRTLA